MASRLTLLILRRSGCNSEVFFKTVLPRYSQRRPLSVRKRLFLLFFITVFIYILLFRPNRIDNIKSIRFAVSDLSDFPKFQGPNIPLISIFINIRNIYKLVINLFTFSRKLKLVFDLAFISRRTTALRKKEGAKNQTP